MRVRRRLLWRIVWCAPPPHHPLSSCVLISTSPSHYCPCPSTLAQPQADEVATKQSTNNDDGQSGACQGFGRVQAMSRELRVGPSYQADIPDYHQTPANLSAYVALLRKYDMSPSHMDEMLGITRRRQSRRRRRRARSAGAARPPPPPPRCQLPASASSPSFPRHTILQSDRSQLRS